MNQSFQKLGWKKNPLLFLFNAPFGYCVNVRKIETYPDKKSTFHFVNVYYVLLWALGPTALLV